MIACEPVSAPETAPVCVAEAAPATHAAPMPEIAPVAPPVAAEPVIDAAGDPIAAVRARLAEIEALLATLPAQSARPKRTAAHERAVRRAWVERKARRDAEQGAAAFRDMAETTEVEYQRVKAAWGQVRRGERPPTGQALAEMLKRLPVPAEAGPTQR